MIKILLFSAFIIILMGFSLWVVYLKNFSIKDELLRSQKSRNSMLQFLIKFSRSLNNLQDSKHLRELVSYYISESLEASSLSVYLLEDDGSHGQYLEQIAKVGDYPNPLHVENGINSIVNGHLRITATNNNFFGRIILDRRSVISSQYVLSDRYIYHALGGKADNHKEIKVRSIIAVPIVLDSAVKGIICAVNSRIQGYVFSQYDLDLLESIAHQAAFTYEFIKISGQLLNSQRIGKELEVAKRIQENLLPKTIDNFGDYRFITYSGSAKEVGGDYYDFVQIDDNRGLIVVADASGKGVPAGMVMTMCRTALRAFCMNFTTLNELLTMLNNVLYENTDAAHFITMAVCLINKSTNKIEYARAGHTDFLTMLPNGEIEREHLNGDALGLLPNFLIPQFEVRDFECPKKQSILLFSDGVTEAMNRKNIQFGIERLCFFWKNALGEDDRSQLPHIIIAAVDAFSENLPWSDDRTLVFIERV